MSATYTMEAQTQVMASVQHYLKLGLAGAVQPGAIRAGWTDPALVQQLDTLNLNPFVAVWFGPSVQSTLSTNPNGVYQGKASLGVVGPDGSVSVVRQVARKRAQLHIGVVAAGERAMPLAQQVRALVASTFGQATVLPLPDSLETITVIDPSETTLGLEATMTFLSEQPSMTMDQEQRRIVECQIIYQVEYSDYATSAAWDVSAVKTFVIVS